MVLLQHPLVQRIGRVASIMLVLVLLGVVTRPVEAPAWEVVKAGQPEMNLEDLEGALGQGLVIGVLGGFRAISADFLWIRMNMIWERRDRTKLDALIRLVTTLDPRPEFFWVNGARMIAYDVPNWRIQEEGGYIEVPEVRQRALDFEQAEQAFALLGQALEFHPDSVKLCLEKAQIYMNRLKDDANAAEWFLKASQLDGAPFYASRIYAQLLRNQGKDEEAYAYLTQLHKDLPNVPFAQKPVILERIRSLEDDLKIPFWKRFQPRAGDPLPTEIVPIYDPLAPAPHDHNCDHGH